MSNQQLELNTPRVLMDDEKTYITVTLIAPHMVETTYRVPGGGAKVLEFTFDITTGQTDLKLVDGAYWKISVDGRVATNIPSGRLANVGIDQDTKTITVLTKK